MDNALELIRKERQRQIEKEGYDITHDDEHDGGELSLAGACYAAYPLDIYRKSEGRDSFQFNKVRPFDEYDIDKGKGEIRLLVIAAALIVADIERLQRKQESESIK